ncbi:MAG: DUF2939 domain-containing protein [Xanthobacteraceae bacterium]
MRKTIAAVVVLGLAWGGYVAWPLYDLYMLVRAFEMRDVETVKRYVYFDSVRRSLAQQIVAAYVRRSGTQVSPLVQSMAGAAFAIADPIVAKVISAEALSEFLTTGWPVTVVPEVPKDAIGISSKSLGNAWQVFVASEYGLARFDVALPRSVPPPQRFGLEFKLLQWRWRLTAVLLPEGIQNVLADELVKAMKAPGRKQ